MASSGPGIKSRHALAFIAVTLLLDTIGFGLIMPVYPRLLVELTGESLSRAAVYGGWLGFVFAAMQFVFAPILGNLSDRYGRRRVILFAVSALGIDYIIMGFAPTLAWLFVGRAIAGAAGASFTPAYAYVADISPPEKRAQNFGVVSAAFGIGFIIGPILGGVYYVVLRDMRGEPVDFGMMFKGFDKFVPLMVIGLIQAIPEIIGQGLRVAGQFAQIGLGGKNKDFLTETGRINNQLSELHKTVDSRIGADVA